MINIRYHIISLVAVFLALAIGLVLGSSFIDTAVVERLRANVDTLGSQKDNLEDDNGRLSRQLDAVEQFEDEAGPQLLDGRLTEVPVFVVAVRGVDEAAVEQARVDIASAGADVAGTLWLTDRLVLDDESERQDLARLLGVDETEADDAAGLRDVLVLRVGNIIADAIRARDPLAPDPDPQTEPPEADGSLPPLEDPPALEPEVLADLRVAGFVDYEPLPGQSGDDGMRLPIAGGRLVVVSGPGAVVPDDQLMVPLLRRLAASGPAAVVAAQSVATDAPAGEEPSRVGFVGAVRDDEELRAALSTIDHLELPFGRFALVLALEQTGDGVVGHYGIGEGSDQVAPVTPEGG